MHALCCAENLLPGQVTADVQLLCSLQIVEADTSKPLTSFLLFLIVTWLVITSPARRLNSGNGGPDHMSMVQQANSLTIYATLPRRFI